MLYAIEISMTRFQKSLGPSVYIINRRIIICISNERILHPLQEMNLYFQKVIYLKF